MANGIDARIVQLLSEKAMTQKELAQKAGITESAVSHYISGNRIPRGVTLMKIATALGTTTDDLLISNKPVNKLEDMQLVKTLIARNAENMSNKERKELIDIIFGEEQAGENE